MKNIKILIEDNCTIITNKIKQKLLKEKYDIEFYDTSFEAENIIKHKNVDLLIVHNIKFLKEIRQNYTKSDLPILLLTHNSEILEKENIYELVNDFLNISIIYEDLLPKIKLMAKRCQKFKTLMELTNKDYLTNTYNKRYFYKKANESYQEDTQMAICMIDMDDFKAINDTYGHIIGDFAIKELANILQKNTKGKDIVSRFGGDEFCLLLQDIDKENTIKLVEKIKKEVSKNSFDIYDTKINFTISVGISTQKANSLDEMINNADLDLLKSKSNKPKIKLCTNCRYDKLATV